jgi:cytochrome c-type biogenesis protein
VGDGLSEQVLSGSLLAALPIAMLAGLVSFASPCVLPLVPGYLGYVTGLSGVDLERQRRWRVLLGAALFVLGFSAVFVLVGFTAGGLGSLLFRWSEQIARVLGVVVIVLGLVFLGWVPGGTSERRLSWRPAAGLAGAPLLGVVFGLGWAPCIGPVFSAVALLSLQSGGAGRGAVLALAYCLGLGLPFVLVAAGIGRSKRVLDLLRRHRRTIARFGGGMLVVVGVLLVSGLWTAWVDAVRIWIEGDGGFRTVI